MRRRTVPNVSMKSVGSRLDINGPVYHIHGRVYHFRSPAYSAARDGPAGRHRRDARRRGERAARPHRAADRSRARRWRARHLCRARFPARLPRGQREQRGILRAPRHRPLPRRTRRRHPGCDRAARRRYRRDQASRQRVPWHRPRHDPARERHRHTAAHRHRDERHRALDRVPRRGCGLPARDRARLRCGPRCRGPPRAVRQGVHAARNDRDGGGGDRGAVVKLGRALRHRNYRLFFAGQGTSLIGTWLTKFAIAYQTFILSKDPFMLGLVAIASQAPTAVQAVIYGFDVPARQAFVRQMVDDIADLPNAIALISSLNTAARIIGPLVAAALVAGIGVGGCNALDAARYIAVTGSLLAMRVAPLPPRPRRAANLDELAAGVAYVRSLPLVYAVLLLLLTTATLAGGYVGLMPAIAQGTLHGGAHALGILLGAPGAGAPPGAPYLAGRESTAGLDTIIGRAALAVGLSLCAFEAITNVWIAVPVMFVLGASQIMQAASTNTLLQATVAHDKLGREMSLYAMVFFAGAPVGALAEGALARQIGPLHAFAAAGVCCVVCAHVYRRR